MQSLHHSCHDTYLVFKGIVKISHCCVFLLLQHLSLSFNIIIDLLDLVVPSVNIYTYLQNFTGLLCSFC